MWGLGRGRAPYSTWGLPGAPGAAFSPTLPPEAALQARLCPGTQAHLSLARRARSLGLQSHPQQCHRVHEGGGPPATIQGSPDPTIFPPAGLLHGSYENLTA